MKGVQENTILALGQRRSESVANYLIANGIKRNSIITKSYGEERPLSLGSNDTSWSKNRRVEIKVIFLSNEISSSFTFFCIFTFVDAQEGDASDILFLKIQELR